ncbi:TIGR04086 family membrane protein [Ornithinibacillus gellani]|uniref:TIGR04086 family membrane protein n=1 Tax=Ornithinibacillus gellani TaxID=2293253 RepID=UPI000F4A2ED1|nr:TIGR04086 family membrane protein [Ornithinibacillus gellani]TQS74666.1 TIGR04086 family membrane protein [Ornithinibacillus gellani]
MKNQYVVALVYGWIAIFGLMLLSSTILALLLKFSNFGEPALSWSSLIIGLLILFIGGLAAGAKAKAKGWAIGGITALGFTLFIFLVQYLGFNQSFSLEQSLHHLGFLFVAVLGGMLGVNSFATHDEK